VLSEKTPPVAVRLARLLAHSMLGGSKVRRTFMKREVEARKPRKRKAEEEAQIIWRKDMDSNNNTADKDEEVCAVLG